MRNRRGAARLRLANALSAHAPETAFDVKAAALAFSPDGSLLALAQPDQHRVLILGVAPD